VLKFYLLLPLFCKFPNFENSDSDKKGNSP